MQPIASFQLIMGTIKHLLPGNSNYHISQYPTNGFYAIPRSFPATIRLFATDRRQKAVKRRHQQLRTLILPGIECPGIDHG